MNGREIGIERGNTQQRHLKMNFKPSKQISLFMALCVVGELNKKMCEQK